jgi:predicted phosphoserine aminotransferase
MYKKLFIPGPSHVSDEILEAMATPMIGHRTKEYAEIQGRVTQKLKKFLKTDGPVLLFTSSGTGAMEAAILNLTKKKVLHCSQGAFGKRWRQISVANGKAEDYFEVPLGQGWSADMVEEKVKTGEYDLVCVQHNETSTGTQNPIEQIAKAVNKYPDVLLAVDAVSALGGVNVEVDNWGIDVYLGSTQKCMGLPPGFTVTTVSPRAVERAKTVPNRGYYFDYLECLKSAEKDQTPITPSVSHIFALDKQLDRIFAEGVEARYARHIEMAQTVRNWAKKNFALFADEKFLSDTVTAIANTKEISVGDLNAELAKRGAMISNGYKDLKDKTFRIAHMGDLTMKDITWLLGQIDEILGL